MQRALTSLGYWPPLSSTTDILESAAEVAINLCNVKVLRYVRIQDPELHAACNAGRQLAEAIRGLMKGIGDPVDFETIDQLRKNGADLLTWVPGRPVGAGTQATSD
jgi:hypothetical protein